MTPIAINRACIPLFHYSMGEAKDQASNLSKKALKTAFAGNLSWVLRKGSSTPFS
jgi:hypothetical protein